MEPGKLSFIPKKQSKTNYKTVYKEAGLGLLMKASVFLFILSVAGFGASYFYKKAITREIDELSVSLDRAKSAFDPSLISEMERLMGSISFAKELLNNHIHPSSIFDSLEEITHEKVGFSSFSFSHGQGQATGQPASGLRINLSGEARSYRVLAEQSLIFEKSDLVRYFSFSGFSSSEDGNVSFSLDLMLDPNILFIN